MATDELCHLSLGGRVYLHLLLLVVEALRARIAGVHLAVLQAFPSLVDYERRRFFAAVPISKVGEGRTDLHVLYVYAIGEEFLP